MNANTRPFPFKDIQHIYSATAGAAKEFGRFYLDLEEAEAGALGYLMAYFSALGNAKGFEGFLSNCKELVIGIPEYLLPKDEDSAFADLTLIWRLILKSIAPDMQIPVRVAFAIGTIASYMQARYEKADYNRYVAILDETYAKLEFKLST
jgi:hypothetical protein